MQGPMVPDEEYEAMDDRLRELQERYPEMVLEKQDTQQMRVQQLQQRRNTLRRILRDAEETMKVVQLQPGLRRTQNRTRAVTGGKSVVRGKEKDER